MGGYQGYVSEGTLTFRVPSMCKAFYILNPDHNKHLRWELPNPLCRYGSGGQGELNDSPKAFHLLLQLIGLRWRLSSRESACNAGDTGDTSAVPRSGTSPGGRHGDPFQYSCLGHPKDRRAWWAAVRGVAKSRTQLKRLIMHALQFIRTWNWISPTPKRGASPRATFM